MLRLLITVSYQLSTLAPKIWKLVPQSVRKCKTLNEFKTKIKFWIPDHCPCRLCKTYMAQLGFIWSAYIHPFMAESGYILVTIVYLQCYVIMMSQLVLLLPRLVTRNFYGQWRFLKIRALRLTFNLQHTKERPRREKFWRFFS